MPRLETGQTAPAFTLSDHTGQPVSLSDFADRNLIIFFYPAAMTPGVHHRGVRLPRLDGPVCSRPGYDVVGISPDKPGEARRFR